MFYMGPKLILLTRIFSVILKNFILCKICYIRKWSYRYWKMWTYMVSPGSPNRKRCIYITHLLKAKQWDRGTCSINS